ncbi:patatin-like phospholipase family protein [Kitasatospora sp. NPDC051853]|uniref:patatin-like phospholipase family protein n=1 Tax=Kitasatospora sp. NPDC051853 TaxID=3364058 RepID=UPI0037BC11D1
MHTVDRALVLGPGGPVGTAWAAGLVHGLLRAGVDLDAADLIVGTSAGAIVGAVLATGQDPGRLETPVRAEGHRVPVDHARMGEAFAVLGDRTLEPEEARRRVGQLALGGVDPRAEEALLAGRAALIGAREWPERRLVITAVEAGTGEPVAWDRDSGAPLVHAVAASSAFPGAAPPPEVDGRRYMDGALRAGVNADLAAGARTLVVVAPMAHLSPPGVLEGQVAAVGARTTETIGPDPASVEAFGPDLGDVTVWGPAYRAGVAQAAGSADRLRSVWGTAGAAG